MEVLYMSRLIALRMPDDLYAGIEANAKAENMNVSQTIIAMLRGDDGPIKSEPVAVVRAKPIAIKEPESPKVEEWKCKCGSSGVVVVSGVKKCAVCGRTVAP
jgi:hypothetical protein